MEVQLLAETWDMRIRDYDAVVVVEAPGDLRLDRVVKRGMPRDDAERRMAAQASDDERRAIATHVIVNDGDLAGLQKQVDAIWDDLEHRHRHRNQDEKPE
jgi:dephospho-CoA kinase